MPFDGIFTKSITEELNNELFGGKVRKIYQPETDEIRLLINKNKKNYQLLISANSNNSRIHLTNTSKSNPDVPPTFCMTLRKHLTNSELLSVEQQNSDRVIILNFRSVDEFGESCIKQLICEITGRNSNIILTLTKDNTTTIIDSLKKVGSGKNRYRQILPGKEYLAPPVNERKSFNEIDETLLLEDLKNSNYSLEKFFINHFFGISPSFIREIGYRTKVDTDLKPKDLESGELKRFIAAFCYQINHLTEASPRMFKHKNQLVDFYNIDLKHLGAETVEFKTYSDLLENFYYLRDKNSRFKAKSLNLKQQLNTLRKKYAKKLQNLDRDYKNSLNNEKNKLYGDLITANIYQLEKGVSEAQLLNYYSEEPEYVTVPLKVNETPSQNAQRFYKKYNKNKRAQEQLEKQISEAKNNLDYIESLLTTLNTSTELEEFEEINYEFKTSNLVKNKSKVKQKPKRSEPLKFKSSEGFLIYVGKNNYQNDYISTKLGQKEDCWLHVKDAPGSHVLIVSNNEFIPEQTVLEGGMLAAYYSKLRESENIPVDYMEFKFVKKPKKSKPGMVTFTEHNTMYITPDVELIENLEKIK